MKVMFATDGSEYAANAASMLAKLSALQPMDLTIVTVAYIPDDPWVDAVRPWDREYRTFLDERVQKVADILSGAAQKTNILRLHGNPGYEILQAVKRAQPDVLVLGAQGHSMLASMLLGSVSEHVAYNAECSVLILRPDAEFAANATQDFQRVTLAFDGSARSQAATEEFSGLTWPGNTEVDVISVAQPATAYYPDYGYGAAQLPDTRQETEAKLRTACRELSKKLPKVSATVVSEHHAGNAIVEHAATNQSELIVIGDSGHNSLERFLLGSTTRYVLRHADCSVWISRFATLATRTADVDASTSESAPHPKTEPEESLRQAELT